MEVQRGKGPRNVGLKIPTKSCIRDASGLMTPPDARREDYFKVYGQACLYRTNSDLMSDKGLKKKLGSLEYINKPCVFDKDMLFFVR